MAQKLDLHTAFSRRVFDPVTVITTDGNTLTATQRGTYLGEAFLWVYRFLKSIDDKYFSFLKEFITQTTAQAISNADPGLILYSALTRFDGVVSVSVNGTPKNQCRRITVEKLLTAQEAKDNTLLPAANNIFFCERAADIAFLKGSAFSTNTADLYYLSYPDTSAMTTDGSAVFNPVINDLLVESAVLKYNLDAGNIDSIQYGQGLLQLQLQMIQMVSLFNKRY